MSDRRKPMQRAIAQQALMRDRALADRAALEARERQLWAKEQSLLETPAPDSVIPDILIALASRQLTSIARDRASLATAKGAAGDKATHHARLARAGELLLARIEAEDVMRRERKQLEALIEQHAGQPRASG